MSTLKNKVQAFANIGSFGLAPLLVSLASIASVPILLSTVGQSAWLSLAVGQVFGDLARSVVIWKWNSTGLTIVANLSKADQIIFYMRSILPRLILLVPTTILLAVIFIYWPIEYKAEAFAMAFGGAIFGLNGSWIFIGAREPKNLLMYNTIPRGISILCGSLSTLIFPFPVVFAIATILGNMVASIGPTWNLRRRARRMGVAIAWPTFLESLNEIRTGFSAFVVGFVMSARIGLPVMLAPILVPGAAPAVALAEKIVRWANTAMTPIVQYIQTSIPRGNGTLDYRISRTTRITWILGPLFGIFVVVTTPILTNFMSAGVIIFGFGLAVPLGVAIGLIFISNVAGNGSLVLRGHIGSVAKAAIFGLIIMVLSAIPLASLYEEIGLMTAFASAEVFIVVYLMILLRKSQKIDFALES